MIKTSNALIFIAALLVPAISLGADGRSELSDVDVTATSLTTEKVGIQPALGTIAYTDAIGNDTSRFAAAVMLQMNGATTFSDRPTPWFFGPTTGVVFSHNGGAGSNWFGADPSPGQPGNGNTVMIPANAKIGYAFNDVARLSARAGGNVIYRSNASQMAIGDEPVTSASDWSIYPNVGLDFEGEVADNVSIFVRPDATITPGNDLYTAMVGVNVTAW